VNQTLLDLREEINRYRIAASCAANIQARIEAAYDSGDLRQIAEVREHLAARWRHLVVERDDAQLAIRGLCAKVLHETHQRGVAGDAGSESHPERVLEWPATTGPGRQ
jgi:hypothetical protein